MEKRRRHAAGDDLHGLLSSIASASEVSSAEWELIEMSEQEDDLIRRMYRLVGDRWALIAGRVPGQTPEAIERYWKMKYDACFAETRLKRKAT